MLRPVGLPSGAKKYINGKNSPKYNFLCKLNLIEFHFIVLKMEEIHCVGFLSKLLETKIMQVLRFKHGQVFRLPFKTHLLDF